MSKKNVEEIWNSAAKVMETQNKVQYSAEINLSLPVGKSDTNIKNTVELLFEIDYLKKRAYIETHQVFGNQSVSSELYYGAYGAFVKYGNVWKKEPMTNQEFNSLFSKGKGFRLTGAENFDLEGLNLSKDQADTYILSSDQHPVEFSKSLLDKVVSYGNYKRKIDKGSFNIEIDKETDFIKKVTIEAEGSFEENNKTQNFVESSVVNITPFPEHFQISLPDAIQERFSGIESLHLQDPSVTLSACSCTGCAACTACLACLACLSCLFPPLAPPAASTAIASAIAAAVSISAGVARAAQVS